MPVWMRAEASACLLLACREPEVMSVFAAIVRRLKQAMEPEVPKVLAAVFEPTLQVRGIGVSAQRQLCRFNAIQSTVCVVASKESSCRLRNGSLPRAPGSCVDLGG